MSEPRTPPAPGSGDPTAIPIEVDPRHQRMVGTARHGNTPFDVPYMSHVEGNLYQGGCATGLVLPPNIDHVISLYPWEQYQMTRQLKSVTFHWLYDDDKTPPAIVTAIAKWVRLCMEDAPTLLHCQAGLNRSGLVAALVLMLGGRSAAESIAHLRESRSPAVLCNKGFESWLLARDAACGMSTENRNAEQSGLGSGDRHA